MLSKLPEMKEVRKLFKYPFKYRQSFTDICDANGKQVLDVRGRGGSFSKAPNGERLQDVFGQYMTEILNRQWQQDTLEEFQLAMLEIYQSDDAHGKQVAEAYLRTDRPDLLENTHV